MRVAHVNVEDARAGAARGAAWLHAALRERGVDSRMVVSVKRSDDPSSHGGATLLHRKLAAVRNRLESAAIPGRGKSNAAFSAAWVPTALPHRLRRLRPDVTHLHWVARGVVRIEQLAELPGPIVWTLRDMWPFTGGCVYAGSCERFTDRCGRCPVLDSDRERDLSRRVWHRKREAWAQLPVTAVGLSSWIADAARRSSLFGDRDIRVIPNGLDPGVFYPEDRFRARKAMGLPAHARIIAFGAIHGTASPRKGFDLFREALERFSRCDNIGELFCLVFGCDDPVEIERQLPVPGRVLGPVWDDAKLRRLYAAADITAVPSRFESFGKTAMESMACGTPVVSFDTSGLRDIVDHEATGYRAACYDAEHFAHGLAWVLANPPRHRQLCDAARAAVLDRFTIAEQARRYHELYGELLEGPPLTTGAS